MAKTKTTQAFTIDIETWLEFVKLSTEVGLKRSFIINSIVREWVKTIKKMKAAEEAEEEGYDYKS